MRKCRAGRLAENLRKLPAACQTAAERRLPPWPRSQALRQAVSIGGAQVSSSAVYPKRPRGTAHSQQGPPARFDAAGKAANGAACSSELPDEPNPISGASCSRPTAASPMPFAPSRWMRSRPRTADIPACRWAWPMPRRALHPTLKFDAADPRWPDRDRFVLSAGHGSMLIYALLYLTGYDRRRSTTSGASASWVRQCAGHPENFELPTASRPPLAPSVRAWRWRSERRSPSGT